MVMAAAGVFEVCGKRAVGVVGVAQAVSSSQSQFVSPQPSSWFVRGSRGSTTRSGYGAGRARAVTTRDPPGSVAVGGGNGSSNGAANGGFNGGLNGAATKGRSMVSVLVICGGEFGGGWK